MDRPVLVFRHVPAEHLGIIAGSLDSAGVPFRYIDPQEATTALPPREAAGLIFMGGPMSANDDLPHIRREIHLIEMALARNQPVLGICLGAQLIAKALGAGVHKNPVREIGWFPVTWTGEARGDPLLAGLDRPETVFHWHGETFDLPSGAVRLAESEACRNQLFRFGSSVYGFQFHLEVTPEMIAEWCAADASRGESRELDRPVDPWHNATRLKELGSLVFGRWVSELPGRK